MVTNDYPFNGSVIHDGLRMIIMIINNGRSIMATNDHQLISYEH